jgi:PEP-CTERM motif-containing protein
MGTLLLRVSRYSLLGAALLWSASAFASLHGFCYGGSPCSDNGTVPPSFGFSVSSGPQTGNLLVDVLVPNNLVGAPGTLGFSITGTQGGATNTAALSGTASLFSPTAWTSGFLAAYLGISASPANPIGAWLPTTQTVEAAATGYFLYQVSLGINQLQPPADELGGPLLNLGGSALPIGSVLVGFLDTGDGIMATANGRALWIEDPPPSVPAPSTLVLFGGALFGFGWLYRRKPI